MSRATRCQCEELSREGSGTGPANETAGARRGRDRREKSPWTAITQDMRAHDWAVGCLRDLEERGARRTRHVVGVGKPWAARIVEDRLG